MNRRSTAKTPFSLTLLLAILLSAPSPAADDPAGGPTEPATDEGFRLEIERSSHVVRPEEDRLLVGFSLGDWRLEALAASVSPRFLDDEDRLGLGVERGFGRHRLLAVVRSTDGAGGEELVGGVGWRLRRGDGSQLGAELVYASDDLAADRLFVDAEEQLFGRLTYRWAGGLEAALFAAESASFDLMRGPGELLERLPRSRIAGAETLADLDIDEGRLEDSAGASLAGERPGLRWRLYLKAGEQRISGVLEGDDLTGYGGELELERERLELRLEADLRDLDSADGVTSFHRARVLVDLLGRLGRLELGAGAYLQGESESLDELADVYDTAGVAFTARYRLASGRTIGLWAMAEDNPPDSQDISRLALFYRPPSGAWELGLGARRDELGRRNFEREESGPFLFAKGRVPGTAALVDGHVGTLDGETYGRILISFKR